MPPINGWKRQQHYSNLKEAREHLGPNGRVKIAVWSHDTAGRVEHVYEPDAEEAFIVRVHGTDREFNEEGRYETRGEGGTANKELMKKYP